MSCVEMLAVLAQFHEEVFHAAKGHSAGYGVRPSSALCA